MKDLHSIEVRPGFQGGLHKLPDFLDDAWPTDAPLRMLRGIIPVMDRLLFGYAPDRGDGYSSKLGDLLLRMVSSEEHLSLVAFQESQHLKFLGLEISSFGW